MSDDSLPQSKTVQNFLYKVIVVGDYAVGKTSLIQRYSFGEFTSNYKITIGVDFSLKKVRWNQKTNVSLQLWDVAGHERFGGMTRIYYQHAIAAVVCFDISRPSTLENVKKWIEDIRDKVELPNGKPIPMILLANKCDIPDVQIDENKMDNFAKENGFFAWFPVSSKTNYNVNEAFKALISQILNVTSGLEVKNPDKKTEGTVRIDDNDDEVQVQRNLVTEWKNYCCN
eukprot:gene10121-2540_t